MHKYTAFVLCCTVTYSNLNAKMFSFAGSPLIMGFTDSNFIDLNLLLLTNVSQGLQLMHTSLYISPTELKVITSK